MKTSVSEIAVNAWASMVWPQRLIVIGGAVLVVVMLVASWATTFSTWREVRGFEKAAAAAKREKEAALATAARVAETIKIREQELVRIEAKRDVQNTEVEIDAADVARARAEYERSVRDRRADSPTVADLCRELAELGYPCG
ncbi:MAG: hypothetical protein IPM50_02690 [Acidobacteriota bacterium]|nr:MAG: hypothetical protein IPM50_02690 [Acidobacteriota bacterium]